MVFSMDALPRICCFDLDTFFVSVERLLDPSLVGVPVIVGAAPGKRGVVTACSYETRAHGVRSGMSSTEAARLAPPGTVFLPGRHATYGPYAKQVKEVLERFTPAVQTASIDEFYLDFRGCERLWSRRGDADDDATIARVVREMRAAVQREIGLPASAGLGCTRAIAKVASGAAKPAGVVVVSASEAHGFLAPLPVRKFPGIGPVAEARLHADGIITLGQLLALPEGPLRARHQRRADAVWGAIHGTAGHRLGRDRPAFREHDPSGSAGTVGSISNERTFHADVGDRQRVENQVRALAERVCWRARQRGVVARTVTVKLRTADFHTVTRGRTVPATHHEPTVVRVFRELLHTAWTRRLPVRLVGVQLSNLQQPGGQLVLPLSSSPAVPQRPAMGKALDAIRERFGYDAVRLGVAEVSAAKAARGPSPEGGRPARGEARPASGSPRPRQAHRGGSR